MPLVSQIQHGSLSTWIQNPANKPKLLKDSYYQLDFVTKPESQKGPILSITKNGESRPMFDLRLRDVVSDGGNIFVAVDVPDKFATKRHLLKFAGDGKTIAEKVDSFSCDTLLRGWVYDKAYLPQPRFPNVVLQMCPWPTGVAISTQPEGWELPHKFVEQPATEYVKAFKEACQVR